MQKFEYRVLNAYLTELESLINQAAREGFEVDHYSIAPAADGYLASAIMKKPVVIQDTAGRSSA